MIASIENSHTSMSIRKLISWLSLLAENIPYVVSDDIIPISFLEDVREISFNDACGKLFLRVYGI